MYDIKGFLETSFMDWPGKICSVLFLPHCNFRCPYCHNHGLILSPERYAAIPWEAILERLVFFRDWIDGVCLTGGEPTLSPDLSPLLQELKRLGFQIKLDTNGSQPQRLEDLIEKRQVDFVSMDVKAPLEPTLYSRLTGSSVNLDLLWRSISVLKRGDVGYEFRMTVVPGLHSVDDVRRLGQQLKAGLRLVLQNFSPENPLDPSLRDTRPCQPEQLRELEKEIQRMA